MTLPNLTPEQVVELYDALLANADRLCRAAEAVMNTRSLALARSLVILALEESGKAIAIHERRVAMSYEPEGTPFVDDHLRSLCRDHRKKLMTVHRFLVAEEYWFAEAPPEPHPLLVGSVDEYLTTLKRWAQDDNQLKLGGFYVDADPTTGQVLAPGGAGEDDVQAMIAMVHQIGWQVRLGDHIRAKGADLDTITGGMRNNAPYLMHPGSGGSPFANMGAPGYEAETREILALAAEIGLLDHTHTLGDADGDNRG